MKFLVMSQMKTSAPPIPKDLMKNTLNAIEQSIKDGKFQMYYALGWNDRSISIEEHDSIEKLYDGIKGILPYYDVEIHPLVDFATVKKAWLNM